MRGPRSGVALVALFLAALTLRPQIVGVGPLFPAIEDDLDAPHAVVGLLGTIPVLCMGLFAPAAAYLSAWIGTRRAMTIGLTLIGAFGVLRAVAPSAWLVVLLTCGVGLGMGLGNALAPIAVREVVPDRPATGTGVYTGGIQIGSTASAALAVPLAGVLGGWRGALIAMSLVALALALVWTLSTRGVDPHVRPPALVPRLPVRSPVAWLLVAIFGLMACAYYGLNAWLPDAYGWALLAGVAQGGMFALVMMLPLDLERRPERVGALVAMMLGFGYTIGATAPFVLGAVRDATGSFAAVLWTCAGFLAVLVVAVAALRRLTPTTGRAA